MYEIGKQVLFSQTVSVYTLNIFLRVLEVSSSITIIRPKHWRTKDETVKKSVSTGFQLAHDKVFMIC